MSFEPLTQIFFFGTIFMMAGIFIWFIVKKFQKRIYLPTLSILNLDRSKKPNAVLKVPPLIPFICFLILTLTLLFASMKPFQYLFSESALPDEKVLVVADMSPSVQRFISISSYRDLLIKSLTDLKSKSSVDFVSSWTNSPVKVETSADIENVISDLTFHRAGYIASEHFNQLGSSINQYTKIVLVTDGSEYSWGDLNVELVASTASLSVINVAEGQVSDVGNLFVNQVSSGDSPSDLVQDLKISISRTNLRNSSGKIQIFVGDKLIKSSKFKFNSKDYLTNVLVSVERADIKDISNGRFSVKLVPETKDEIELDNTYFFNFSFNTGRVFLVGQTQGEQYLEDPNKQLDIAFKVNGYAVERKDQISAIPDPNLPEGYNIVVTQFSGSRYDFCPSGLNPDLDYDIWMVPESIEKNAKTMCECLGKILKKSANCSNIFDRESFVNTLQNYNFDPIGGAMGDYLSAPFFRYDNGSSYILVSTISLNPRVEGGIKHGKLPILVSDLIKLSSRATLEDFEYGRIVYSISKFWGDELDTGKENIKTLDYANIPKGESSFVLSSKLDQLTMTKDDKDIAGVETSRLEKSSKNIVGLIFQIICFVFALEILFYLTKVILKRKSKGNKVHSEVVSVLLSMILFSGALHSDHAFGYHRIDVLNTSYGSFNKLLKDVENRTSIDTDKPSQRVVSLSKNLSSSYWIWTKGTQSILGTNRKMNENLALWIKKGGLLVVQGNFSKYQLDLLTAQFFTSEGKTGKWKIITPDHEIMRSFYLIDSLPSCDDNPWFEFRYDGRMSILVIPDDFLNYVTDRTSRSTSCKGYKSREKLLRTFINVSMVALTTDYKKDQIHLPEILKRLR